MPRACTPQVTCYRKLINKPADIDRAMPFGDIEADTAVVTDTIVGSQWEEFKDRRRGFCEGRAPCLKLVAHHDFVSVGAGTSGIAEYIGHQKDYTPCATRNDERSSSVGAARVTIGVHWWSRNRMRDVSGTRLQTTGKTGEWIWLHHKYC
jgi:hypothetical protein